jgi:hypothetical protein
VYYAVVLALTLVLPLACAAWEAAQHAAPLLLLFGKWMTFFAVGVRLALAGLRQIFQPRFTLRQIFEIESDEATQIVQELGFANVALAPLGLLALTNTTLTFAGALTGGIFYGLAGFKHLTKRNRNALANTAMASDLFVFAVLGMFVAFALVRA